MCDLLVFSLGLKSSPEQSRIPHDAAEEETAAVQRHGFSAAWQREQAHRGAHQLQMVSPPNTQNDTE